MTKGTNENALRDLKHLKEEWNQASADTEEESSFIQGVSELHRRSRKQFQPPGSLMTAKSPLWNKKPLEKNWNGEQDYANTVWFPYFSVFLFLYPIQIFTIWSKEIQLSTNSIH